MCAITRKREFFRERSVATKTVALAGASQARCGSSDIGARVDPNVARSARDVIGTSGLELVGLEIGRLSAEND